MFWQVSSSEEVLYLTSALQTKPGFIPINENLIYHALE
jgi:hypothetical protein